MKSYKMGCNMVTSPARIGIGDFDSTSMGVPVFFYPHAGWAFKIAPGVKFEDGGPNFGLRLGIGYEFDIAPKWLLVPELNADFVGGETEFVYGVSFTRKFHKGKAQARVFYRPPTEKADA